MWIKAAVRRLEGALAVLTVMCTVGCARLGFEPVDWTDGAAHGDERVAADLDALDWGTGDLDEAGGATDTIDASTDEGADSAGVDSTAGDTSRADLSSTSDAGADMTSASDGVTADTGGQVCSNAVVLALNDSFSGTTCGSADTYTVPCGAGGTPEMYFAVNLSSGQNVTVTVSSGVVWQANYSPKTGATCWSTELSCHTTSKAAFGYLPQGVTWFFVLEMATGGCGPFTISTTPTLP